MAHAWLEQHGLISAYRRVFDEEDFPRDVPSSYTALLAPVLPPTAMDKVLLAVAAAPARLSSVLSHTYTGRPRVPFSSSQLGTGFELFPPPFVPSRPSAAPSASSSHRIDPAAPLTHTSTSSSDMGAAGQDPRIRQMELSHDALTTLCSRILRPFHTTLMTRSWDDWDVLGNRNPFSVKFTPATAASLGVPTYFNVISPSKAMDLVRIGERISGLKYKHVAEMLADVALMLLNAKTFNKPDSVAHAHGFPPPERFPRHVMHGSVYRMAFELEAEVAAAAPGLLAAWDAAVYDAQRRMYDVLMADMKATKAAPPARVERPAAPPVPHVAPVPVAAAPPAAVAAELAAPAVPVLPPVGTEPPPAPVEPPRKRPRLVLKA